MSDITDMYYVIVNGEAIEMQSPIGYEDAVRAATGNFTEPVGEGFIVTYRHRDATGSVGWGGTLIAGGKRVPLMADYATILNVVQADAA